MPFLSVVIPAYNEEESIEETTRRCLAVRDEAFPVGEVEGMEVIVVDDGSTDRTTEIVKGIGEGVRLIRHPVNRNYGAALKTGFAAAKGDLLAFLDADGTCSPEKFPDLCRAREESDADILVGMRLTPETKMPWVRKLGNRFYATLLSVLSGQKVTDTASGMRVLKRSVFEALLPLPDGLNFTPAMTTKAIHESYRLVEHPIPYAERGGRSKLSVLRDGYWFFRIILDTVLLYNPVKVFAILGAVSMLVALLLGSAPALDALAGRQAPYAHYIYRLVASFVFGAIGVVAVTFGLVSGYLVSVLNIGRDGRQYGDLARMVLKRRMQEKLGLLGVVLAIAGFGVWVPYGWQHIFGGGIALHWSYMLFASLAIVMGAQMASASLLVKIMKDSQNEPGEAHEAVEEVPAGDEPAE